MKKIIPEETGKKPYQSPAQDLYERFEFRNIRPEEAEQAAEIERICFPPNEACSRERIFERVAAAPELFLVAADKQTGRLAGFLNGLSTEETSFRDEFFTDITLYHPEGKTIMLLGLDVLPEYRRQGLGRELMNHYLCRERQNGRRCILLTCLQPKVEMYKKMGFCDNGIANSSWGGEEWHEMSHMIQ
ncbi:MAG: GNAT family N-acetyltransferase [Lachnospiraceae bacterium]|nr:GNAT family N-acetyltransferase [Lachnospiraceae bacterium]